MNDGTTTILAGLQQQIDSWRLVTHLQAKDRLRAVLVIPKPPRWTDTTPALAAQVYEVHKSSLLHALHSIKLIWDKRWHMGAQAKAAHTAEE